MAAERIWGKRPGEHRSKAKNLVQATTGPGRVYVKSPLLAACALIGAAGQVQPAHAEAPATGQAQPPAVTVFQNVRIFDGKGSQLSAPSSVLVRGNRIER